MRPRKRELNRFGRLFDEALADAARGKPQTQREFLEQAGVNAATLSDLKHREARTRAPDPDTIRAWAKVLGLRGQRAEAFVEAAMLVHSPPYVQELVARLRRQLGEE